MSFINLEVSDSETGLQWSIGINRRITIIRGDSGIGKTELVRLIASPPVGVEVNVSLPCVVADATNWNAILDGSKNSIIILDDAEFVSSGRFAKKVKDTEENQNYFLIIGREQISESELADDSFYKLSYSVDSILRFVVSDDGKKHFTVPFFDFENNKLVETKVKYVVVEDSANGYTFFRKLLGNCVISAKNGKSSMIEDTISTVKNTKDYVLALFDSASFGCHADKFYYTVIMRYGNICVDLEYECLEYFLLNTNFFKENQEVQSILSAPFKEANQYISWEKFFEALIERVTNKTTIKYVHGNAKFRECWYEACDDFENNNCNEYIQRICQFYLNDNDKCKALLESTMFQRYLILRDCIQDKR